MKSIKQIIVLGSGASKSEGAPLQNELFYDFFEYYKDTILDWVKTHRRTKTEKHEYLLYKFFKDFWGYDIENIETQKEMFPTFEECVGILDLASTHEESFKNYEHEKINKTRKALILLMAIVINNKLGSRPTQITPHQKLIQRLIEEGNLKKTAFISLNYDILLDNSLTKLYPDFHLDYGIDFINFERSNDWARPDKEKAVLLLKPHGSFNWLFCPTCNNLELTPGMKEKVRKALLGTEKCECGTPLDSVIIPPTFYKDLSNPFIQNIFFKTDQTLRQVDKIFFCGYSFPDADLHIKYHLKRAELFAEKTPEIYVINKEENEDWEQWRGRKEGIETQFKRFFKNKDKVHVKDLSFKEFAENGVDINSRYD